MIKHLITKLMGRPERHPEQQDIEPVSPVQESDKSINTPHNVDPEIQIIAGRYGELVPGKVIETTLTELQEILPRPRKRADAYATVAKRLAAMGVTLVIKREVRHDK